MSFHSLSLFDCLWICRFLPRRRQSCWLQRPLPHRCVNAHTDYQILEQAQPCHLFEMPRKGMIKVSCSTIPYPDLLISTCCNNPTTSFMHYNITHKVRVFERRIGLPIVFSYKMLGSLVRGGGPDVTVGVK